MKKMVLVSVFLLLLVFLLFVIGCTPKFDPPRPEVLEEIGEITADCVNTSTGYECSFNLPDYELYVPEELVEMDIKLIEIGNILGQRCEDAGGKFECYGSCLPTYERICDFPFEDAGQPCKDNAECHGYCLADKGDCETECTGTCATYRLNMCDNPTHLTNGVAYFEPVECD